MTNQPSATWGPEFPAIFDRQSKKLTARSFKAWLQVRCIQVSSKALAPVGYVGISRVHGAINALLRPSGDTLIIDKGSLFRFPANDYYWNRLLDTAWHYEPEIDRFLSEHSEVPFVFVDLGANFGFWSSRVAQGEFGAHHVIAVEPADSCLDVLHRNIVGHGSPVIVHKRIIDEISGVPSQLFGSRHAGFSVDSHWSGASDTCVNEALTLSSKTRVKPSQIAVWMSADALLKYGIGSVCPASTIPSSDSQVVEISVCRGPRPSITNSVALPRARNSRNIATASCGLLRVVNSPTHNKLIELGHSLAVGGFHT
ncbi:MAG: hypothetical protein JW395_0482 [Nitrospira sp.]|nr:hypothetical protein [Nitrospira sp.]